MRRLTPFALLMTALSIAACGDDGPGTADDDDAVTGGRPTTMTGPGTTTDGTTAPSTPEPGTTAPGETTMVATDGVTTTDATTDVTTGATMQDTEPTTTGDGTTAEETAGAAAGWADCFGDASACVGAESCLFATDPDGLQGSFCSVQNCTDADDCSALPTSGTAVPSCEDVGSDGIAECYLSCAGGATCPDGMECWNTLACVWPETDWTCPLSLYDQTGLAEQCDCGCGLPDPDCADGSMGACDVCDNPGSCSAEACPGSISEDNNSLCAG